jgi:hypothetical protein
MNTIGRYCKLNNQEEVKELRFGMDFREPKYRREVFLRFYEFHLKYKAHAGAVYYVFPFLFEKYQMTTEQKLWFAYINGCTQNVISTFMIWEQIPNLNEIDLPKFSKWFRTNYDKLGWDTDRRYVKNVFEDCIQSYIEILGGKTQEEYFNVDPAPEDKYLNFNMLWDKVINNFPTFGRLATFSYLEYLKIVGLNIDCTSLFLDDISGSKSHRNGLCKVLGRDDLDWYKTEVIYDEQTINWLGLEGALLLEEAKQRFPHEDISYFTLETTLCCYKSWHRPNRRYPNVYNDMFYDRIKYAESKWRKKLPVFWEARKKYLPKQLRLEDNPADLGVHKSKQNHYRLTGQVIMMDKDWGCFENDYNDFITNRQ